MSITFKPAQLDGVGLFVAIAGGSRTGKTFTGLTLARGIAGPNGRIAAIDTEGKRMSHYKADFLNADGTPFDVFNMQSPFTADRFVEAAKAAEDAGYAVLIIDNFSLEWSGYGGVLDFHENETLVKKTKNDLAWAIAKRPHKRMLNELIQRTIPIIFCLRANEVPDHLGGGWKVDQDKKFLYEWTVALTLHPDSPGMPRYDMVDAKKKPLWKVQDQHRHLFPEGKLITREAGAALQQWRNTDTARATTTVNREVAPPTPEEVKEALVARFEMADAADDLAAIELDELASKQIAWLAKKHPALGEEIEIARAEAKARTGKVRFGTPNGSRQVADDGFPLDVLPKQPANAEAAP